MIRRIEENLELIKELCQKHSVAELYLFGSAASGAINESSDLDFAVIFRKSLSPIEHGEAYFALLDDLEELFEQKIDLISYRAIKNPVFMNALNDSKVSLYAA